MTDFSFSEQIQIFKSVFKGREDVFAVRWEKGNKKGYMPAYFLDPYRYRAHKIILETLDTEEATYLWHFTKDRQILKMRLKEIDRKLRIIKNKGRQAFLDTQPENFSRILHDYADEKKGFILWKDFIEEQIK